MADITPSSHRPCAAEMFKTASREPIMQSIIDRLGQTDNRSRKSSRLPTPVVAAKCDVSFAKYAPACALWAPVTSAVLASMAEWLWAWDTLAVMKLWWREVVSSIPDRGTIVGRVFSPTRQPVRFSHPNVPFFQNSEFIWNIVPVGKQ